MSRAGAVVVHSRAMEKACKERGVAEEDLFFVPYPVCPPDDLDGDREWLRKHFGLSSDSVNLYCAITKPESAATVAKAIAQAAHEETHLNLFVHCDESNERAMRLLAQGTELEERLFFVTKEDSQAALRSADVLLAIEEEIGPRPSGLVGLLHGATLLAADIAPNREITPDGAGCLWFKQDDPRDLAHRAAFLARNADFRRALAETGYNVLMTTRDPEAIGRKYDQVYRHAQQKAKRGNIEDAGSAVLVAAKLSA
jgi:glycosyltransferase involved in cell wall biosynthesis